MTTGKRIGFVDHVLDNFHANLFLDILRGELADRGFSVAGCHASNHDEGHAWGKKHSVVYFESPAELNSAVDAFMVIAPSNPELHLGLCRKVVPFGKPTWVDKTFAPDLATAEAIFALADQHHATIESASVLRYTNVQTWLAEHGRPEVEHMVAWGGGRSFAEYAVHPTEFVISCMGPEVVRLMRRTSGESCQLLLDFSRGRTAVINVYINTKTPYAAGVTAAGATQIFTVDDGRMFPNAAGAILDFFAGNRPPVDRRETLVIRRILDAAADLGTMTEFTPS